MRFGSRRLVVALGLWLAGCGADPTPPGPGADGSVDRRPADAVTDVGIDAAEGGVPDANAAVDAEVDDAIDAVIDVAEGGAEVADGIADLAPAVDEGAPTAYTWRALFMGGDATCGLEMDGTPHCTGEFYRGDGTNTWTRTPALVRVAGSTLFKQLSVSTRNICGTTLNDQAACWGWNDFEQAFGSDAVCDGITCATRPTPTPTQAVVGSGLVVQSERSLVCTMYRFGGSHRIQCAGKLAAAPFGSQASFLDIATGEAFACGVDSAGQINCGVNLGFTFYPRVCPRFADGQQCSVAPVTPGTTFKTISADAFTVCTVDSQGVGWCWGASEGGILGDGVATPPADRQNLVAVKTPAGKPLATIVVSRTNACALTAAGEIFCWGGNGRGALGQGTVDTASHPTPIQVTGIPAAASVAVGSGNACILTASGKRWCWGANDKGQLGDGTMTNRPSPVNVP